MSTAISAITAEVQQAGAFVTPLLAELGKVVIGQRYLVERLCLGLLVNGHLLLEGVPGLAKTLAVKSLAGAINLRFSRLQFTPDMLPADVIGTQIYNPQSGAFTTRRGPIFANLVLADEINRAPAKVQSALLEAMQERQVTIGDQTFKLEEPFLVLATQNPIEQEGTYPLPEAQVDRFLLKLKVIVCATRSPQEYKLPLKDLIQLGASPRATIALTLASKAHAFIKGRGYVTPQDIKSIAMDALRHRVAVTYEAEAEEKTSENIIQTILDTLPVP